MSLDNKRIYTHLGPKGHCVIIEDVGSFSLRAMVEEWWELREAEKRLQLANAKTGGVEVPTGSEIKRVDQYPNGDVGPGKYTFYGEEGSETRKQHAAMLVRNTEAVEETEPDDLPDDTPSVKTEFDVDTIRAEAPVYGTSSIGVGDHVPRFQFEHCGETHTYIREDHVQALLKEQEPSSDRGPYDTPAGAYICYATFKVDGDARDFQHCLWHDHTTLEADEQRVKGYFVPEKFAKGNLTEEMVLRGIGALTNQRLAGVSAQQMAEYVYSEMDRLRPMKEVEDAWRNAVRSTLSIYGAEDEYRARDAAATLVALRCAIRAYESTVDPNEEQAKAELQVLNSKYNQLLSKCADLIGAPSGSTMEELPMLLQIKLEALQAMGTDLTKYVMAFDSLAAQMQTNIDNRVESTPQVTAYYQGGRNAYAIAARILRGEIQL